MKRAFVLAVVASGSLLGFVPGAQADLRAGNNFRLNSDSEPTRGKDQLGLAVNPNNPQHIVAVMENYLTEECEGTRSLDGGATWSVADPFANPASTPAFAPTCRIGNHLGD